MTLRLEVANLDFATGVRKDRDQLGHLVRRLYARADKHLSGMVLLTQETKNIRLLAVLRVVGGLLSRTRLPVPSVMQGHGPAKSGTALAAYGVKLHRPRLFLGGRSRSTLPRWVTRGWVAVPSGRLYVFSAHVPPPRAGDAAQVAYLQRVRKRLADIEARGHGWVVGADFNHNLAGVARLLGGHGYGTIRGIGFVASHNVKVSGNGRDDYGMRHGDTDHPAWWLDAEDVS